MLWKSSEVWGGLLDDATMGCRPLYPSGTGGLNLGSAIVLELIMLHCIQYLFIISVFFYYPKL
jgi:hypothetical protein